MRVLSGARPIWAAVLVLVVFLTTFVTAGPAQAGPNDPLYLSVTKTVSNATPEPGEPFTYTIRVTCSEASCINASLNDALPVELEGYAIENVTFTPSAGVIPRNVTWNVDGIAGAVGGAAPAVATANTVLHVDFTGATTAPLGIGLQNGQTFTVLMTLRVPMDLDPGTTQITNTATTVADNSLNSSSAAVITVTMPQQIGVDVTKTWTPAAPAFVVGKASAIALTAKNTSNIRVDSLVVQEPQAATEGAAALDASNPFTLTNFDSFAAGSALPNGATTVQVDAYVLVGGVWRWVTGTPQTTPALPAAVVNPTDVGGLRFTYAGGQIGPGALATVTLNVAQRAADRTGADLSAAKHAVTNVVLATAVAAGLPPATDTASAPYAVSPANVLAETSKSITPARIAAGSNTSGRIVATNASGDGVVVTELKAADLNYFTNEMTFGGFTAPITWPAGTNSAVVIYHHRDVAIADLVVPFTSGDTPTPPSQKISGFEVVFTSTTGGIAAGASSTIDFGIRTTEAAIGAASQLATTNTVTTTVTASNGLQNTATGTAGLVLLKPALNIDLTKTILPSGTVAPGDRVVTLLNTKLTTTSDYITPKKIVVEDAWTVAGGFWDAFNLDSVAPTQVPANASILIQVQLPAPVGWVQVASPAVSASPTLVAISHDDLVAAVNVASGGAFALGNATGIRFTFENASGLANDTIVKPYVVSRARDTLRSDVTKQTAPVPNVSSSYRNAAVSTGTGVTKAATPTPITASDTDIKTAAIRRDPGIGIDGIGISKKWNVASVPAQSGATPTTTLAWSVHKAYQQVVITDPENFGDPQNSVFQAFDLKSIGGTGSNGTPFTDGWYLKYDTIDSIQLYSPTFTTADHWKTVSPPAGGWINSTSLRFNGHTLSAADSAVVTGFRITLKENTAARTAALASGSDPYAPELGSGVAQSSNARNFTLNWELRNRMRVGNAWVTDKAFYNTVDAGIVDNTVQVDATPVASGPVTTDRANARIALQGFTPGVTVDKTVTPATEMYVPMAGAPASSYPTAIFNVTAKSNSVVRASYVRVMDSPVCIDGPVNIADCEGPATAVGATADPFTPGVQWLTAAGQGNPFDRFDLTGVTIAASVPAQVSLADSVVWLLRYNAGTQTYSTVKTTAAAVNATTAGGFPDVVGISVTFQGSNPAINGGTITASNVLTVRLDTKLRTHLRVSGEPQTLGANQRLDVLNRAFAQSYDPVLNNEVQTGMVKGVNAKLTGGDINVAAVKTISPAALTEPNRGGVVTVKIGANQGSGPVSSLPPAEVRLTDDTLTSPAFWNQFSFTGLGSLSAPSNADQVVVSVYGPFGAAGAMAWVSSGPQPIVGATVPVAVGRYPDIQGVELAFSRANGAFFSASSWNTLSTFTVALRDTYRDSDEDVVLAGSVVNTVTVISDRLNGEKSEEKSTTAQIGLSSGTYALKVNKLANDGNHTASAGESVPWDVTFTNAGTGFLTITELRDTLPASLVYLGDTAPVYTPDPSGILPAPGTMSQVGKDLVFTWPSGARSMAPGETFSVRLLLEVQPGISAGQRATNEMTVTTAQTLATCGNIDAGGATTGAFAADPTTCGTTDYVTPTVGPNIFTVKGVRGSLPGAENPGNPSQTCVDSLNATGGSYYRAPCAANSVIGGVDEWVLRAQNAGTTGLDDLVLFDALPSGSDRYLISGLGRGSEYRPQMLDDLAIAAPTGTNILVEVTLSADPCYGTWAGLEGHQACEQNSEVWSTADLDTDWSSVTALRITLDFDATDRGFLAPGEFVDATFSTKNVPASTANPSGASVNVPAVDSYAWNQFGVKYLDTGATLYRKIAPARMGIHLQTGALQIDKVVTGPGASLAPSSFVVGLACTVEGVPLNMGDFSAVELSRANGFSQLVEGLPSGSVCVMTETQTGGAARVSFAGLDVERVSPISASVSVVQGTTVVTLTNDFDSPPPTGSLRINKVIAGPGASRAGDTFVVGVVCTVDGEPVDMGDSSEMTLRRSDGFSASIDGLPSGSVCVMTETQTGGANIVAFTGIGVERLTRVSASVSVSDGGSIVTLTNSYVDAFAGPPDEQLAFTGATGVRALVLWALVLLALGTHLAIRSRRRLS